MGNGVVAADAIRLGILEARAAPALAVFSGGTATLECLSGGPEVTAPDRTAVPVPPAPAAIHAADLPRLRPPMLTSPVAVRGAVPGDILEVRIEAVEPAADRSSLRHPSAGRRAARRVRHALPQPHPDRPRAAPAKRHGAPTCGWRRSSAP